MNNVLLIVNDTLGVPMFSVAPVLTADGIKLCIRAEGAFYRTGTPFRVLLMANGEPVLEDRVPNRMRKRYEKGTAWRHDFVIHNINLIEGARAPTTTGGTE